MSSVSIIGTGNMASALADRALAGGNAVEIIGRDPAKAKELADALGNGATAGTWGAAPAGEIVILAVLFDSAVPVVSKYGDAPAGKIIINITNPTRRQLRLNSSPHPARAPSRLKGSRLRRAVPLPWGWLCRRGRPRWRRRWRGSRC